MRIFLSAGHVPSSPGATSSWTVLGPAAGDLVEHDLNVLFVHDIASALRVLEPSVVPVDVLRRRVQYVNRWSRPGDLALEIHHNSFRDAQARGVEAFALADSRGGRRLAEAVHRAVEELEPPGRGVRDPRQSQHPSLHWLTGTRPWAALLEVEFISNPEAAAWLVGGGAAEAAQAVARALDELT